MRATLIPAATIPVSIFAAALVMAVHASVPANNLAEFIAWAKANPNQANFGSPGAGAMPHFMGALIGKARNVDLKHVPYRGSAPSLQDMLAGVIPSMFDPITTNVPHINSGKVRLLAVSSDKRIDLYPNAPTFAEQGFPKMTTSTWVGVSGPKGMPGEIVARLYDEILGVCEKMPLPASGALTPAIQRLARQGATLKELADWPGMDRERATRLLNALYLQSGLIVSRSHPDAVRDGWF